MSSKSSFYAELGSSPALQAAWQAYIGQAQASAAAALASQTAAAASQASANSSASSASTSATNAATSATNAASSASAAAASATSASTSATTATTQATNAGNSATSASSSASTATTQATNASNSATAAAGSASAAATSATNAANSASAAAASAASTNLPSGLGSNTLSMIRANAAGTGYEFRTPAQVLTDLGLPDPAVANELDYIRINSTGTAFEARTPSQVWQDILTGTGGRTAATARTDLGLASGATTTVGTAATQNTGTSGSNVPLLNGANTWSATQTLTALLQLTSNTNSSAVEEFLNLYRNHGTNGAANDYLEAVAFSGKNSAGAQKTFAREYAQIISPTSAAESGAWLVDTIQGGTLTQALKVVNGLQVGAPTGGDKGAGSMNLATELYLNGVQTRQIAQVVNTETGAVATGTTQMSVADSIPTNTQGDQYMSLSITPTNSSSTLIIDVVGFWSSSTAQTNPAIIVGLFQDTTANALAAAVYHSVSSTSIATVAFRHKMTAGTTSATTFKVRAGPTASGTVTFNGETGGRLLGGVLASSITITEILP